MIEKGVIENIVNEQLKLPEEFVVDISISAANSILVLIDSDDGVTIDRCVAVSKAIEQAFDREQEDFELEVSSAGLSSPLKVLRQYQKNIGRNLDVVTFDGKKISGKLTETKEDGVILEVEEMVKQDGKKRKELAVRPEFFSFKDIKSAKIVISFR